MSTKGPGTHPGSGKLQVESSYGEGPWGSSPDGRAEAVGRQEVGEIGLYGNVGEKSLDVITYESWMSCIQDNWGGAETGVH